MRNVSKDVLTPLATVRCFTGAIWQLSWVITPDVCRLQVHWDIYSAALSPFVVLPLVFPAWISLFVIQLHLRRSSVTLVGLLRESSMLISQLWNAPRITSDVFCHSAASGNLQHVTSNGTLEQGLLFALCISSGGVYQVFPPWSGLFELSLMSSLLWSCAFGHECYPQDGRVILGKCVYSSSAFQISTVSFQPARTGCGHMEVCPCLRDFSHDVFSFPIMCVGTVRIEGRRVNVGDGKGWSSAWQILQVIWTTRKSCCLDFYTDASIKCPN